MRQLITGIDGDGRSAVLQVRDVSLVDVAPGLAAQRLLSVDAEPSARPSGRGAHIDLGVPTGAASALVWRFAPAAVVDMHHTDTVDAILILEGSVELLLEDGSHPLTPGDWVIVNGVDHGWQAGPDGCLSTAFAVGTPPPGTAG